jgi:D-glycero-alpha-D-manno-heptose-7-phosphate kinase
MFMRALALHNYDGLFDFGMNVKVNCEFGAIGLSTSSSVASLYNAALSLICAEPYDPLAIAKQTQAVEPHWYGRQDQLSVSYGGFNLWHMGPGEVRSGTAVSFGEVDRYPINLRAGAKERLSDDCFLIYDSGIEEGAKGVLASVADNYEKDTHLRAAFEILNSLAQDIYVILNQPNGHMKWLYELGHAFDYIREVHERLHPSVTNQRMQDMFRTAKKAGALGGRYSGAGGRGALTFICKPGETAKISAALDAVTTLHHCPDGRVFRTGKQIHFGGFGDARATARYES